MSKISLFYGITTGKTENAAEMIQDALGGDDVVTMHDIADVNGDKFSQYEYMIIGCPTWNIGELQSNWESYIDELDDIDFNGKKVAYFGTGDQIGYADNFQDAMGILEEKISGLGDKTVGLWSTDGYEDEASLAVKNGQFVGLALDDDNQAELTKERVQKWVTQLKAEFNL